ncbi:MAG TPA: isoprenylcysteine carboxylmethyltransferase family protein [Thermoanaerobaculia bacterium]|nr:isoprenylcysteine carboxylmethyltransferase family protein [Thermoanaerobaculia bacterium]
MKADSPGIYVPPPFIYVFFFIAGYLTRRWLPLTIPYHRPAGTVLVVLSLALGAWGIATLWLAGTGIVPHKPASTLVDAGPFRYSRNPLYVSLTLLYIGIALWIPAISALVVLPLVIAVIQFAVIRREEAYLTRRFGSDYEEYRRRVRRWI